MKTAPILSVVLSTDLVFLWLHLLQALDFKPHSCRLTRIPFPAVACYVGIWSKSTIATTVCSKDVGLLAECTGSVYMKWWAFSPVPRHTPDVGGMMYLTQYHRFMSNIWGYSLQRCASYLVEPPVPSTSPTCHHSTMLLFTHGPVLSQEYDSMQVPPLA